MPKNSYAEYVPEIFEMGMREESDRRFRIWVERRKAASFFSLQLSFLRSEVYLTKLLEQYTTSLFPFACPGILTVFQYQVLSI